MVNLLYICTLTCLSGACEEGGDTHCFNVENYSTGKKFDIMSCNSPEAKADHPVE